MKSSEEESINFWWVDIARAEGLRSGSTCMGELNAWFVLNLMNTYKMYTHERLEHLHGSLVFWLEICKHISKTFYLGSCRLALLISFTSVYLVFNFNPPTFLIILFFSRANDHTQEKGRLII